MNAHLRQCSCAFHEPTDELLTADEKEKLLPLFDVLVREYVLWFLTEGEKAIANGTLEQFERDMARFPGPRLADVAPGRTLH